MWLISGRLVDTLMLQSLPYGRSDDHYDREIEDSTKMPLKTTPPILAKSVVHKTVASAIL